MQLHYLGQFRWQLPGDVEDGADRRLDLEGEAFIGIQVGRRGDARRGDADDLHLARLQERVVVPHDVVGRVGHVVVCDKGVTVGDDRPVCAGDRVQGNGLSTGRGGHGEGNIGHGQG